MKIALACGSALAMLALGSLPADASTLRPGAVVGLGVVGPNQYDNGQAKGMVVAGVHGPWHPDESWSFGGLALGFRASNGLTGDFSEVGITVPLATYRKGRWISQAGVMIQRLNLQKHVFFLGAGVHFGEKR
jgi:hypothetical protein